MGLDLTDREHTKQQTFEVVQLSRTDDDSTFANDVARAGNAKTVHPHRLGLRIL